MIQYGDFYRLGDLRDVCGFETVSARKDRALASIIMPRRENGVSNRRIAFKGLNEATKYKAIVYNKDLSVNDEFTADGAMLLYGIPYEKYRLSEDVCSDADFRTFLIEFIQID